MKPSNKICMVPKVFFRRRLENGYSVVRDAMRRSLVTGIASSFNGNTVESIAYSYDALGRPVARNADAFGYNDRGEVTSALIMGWSPSPSTASYGYDDIGNLQFSSFNAATNAYTANGLNQYTSILCDSATLCEPTYDTDGNMLSDGVLSFTYDAASRLKTVSSNGVTLVTNFYDAKSRRVKKVTPNATTTFFYDDWNLVEERIAYADNTTSTIRYYWGDDLSGTLQGAGGVGGLLWLTVDGTIYIPCYDNNGNVTRYLSVNGGTFARYSYDAFGKLIARAGRRASFFRHRFSTKYYDTETGLYYYGYRFYHPVLMRWMNRDTIAEEGGDNLYNFILNNAVAFIDHLGLRKYVLGGHGEPHVNFDSDFSYNPNVKPSTGDYLNWMKWKSKLYGARLIGHLEDGTLMYKHYLDGTGTPMTVDYVKAYREDSGIAVSVRNAVREAQKAAERLSKSGGREFEMSSDAGNADKYPTTENWQKAIGGHSLWGEATVYNCDDKFSMMITIHAIDRYNFNKGAKDIATGTPDNENGRFEELGWARSFVTRGSIPVKVNWKRGDIEESELGTNDRLSIGRSRARGR